MPNGFPYLLLTIDKATKRWWCLFISGLPRTMARIVLKMQCGWRSGWGHQAAPFRPGLENEASLFPPRHCRGAAARRGRWDHFYVWAVASLLISAWEDLALWVTGRTFALSTHTHVGHQGRLAVKKSATKAFLGSRAPFWKSIGLPYKTCVKFCL